MKLTSKTADATEQAIGFPPNVLKYNACDKVLAISGVVTIAPIGNPLPIPLAIVTMSGITSWFSKPQ